MADFRDRIRRAAQRLARENPDDPQVARAELHQALAGDFLGEQQVRLGAGVEDFRPLTVGSRKDLEPMKQERAIELSHRFYRSDPSYKHDIHTLTDFVVGEGLKWEAENDELAAFIGEWWGPNGNDIDGQIFEMVSALLKYGEQVYPAIIGTLGMLRLGVIDPLEIEEIEVDPLNVKVSTDLILKRKTRFMRRPVRHLIIRQDPFGFADPKVPGRAYTWDMAAGPGKPRGVFYFAIGKEQTGTRGWPCLADGFDWYDLQATSIYRFAQRASILNTVVWQVRISGVDNAEFQRICDEIEARGTPAGETIRCVSENMEWDPKTPTLGTAENEMLVRILSHKTSDSSGLPPHWRGFGYETSMATAKEMGHAPFRQFARLQAVAVTMLRSMLDFSLWYAKTQAGRLQNVPGDELFNYQIVPHPIRDRDRKAELEQLQTSTTILLIAVDHGMLTTEEAVGIWRSAARLARFSLAADIPAELLVAPEEPAATGGAVSGESGLDLLRRAEATLTKLRGQEAA